MKFQKLRLKKVKVQKNKWQSHKEKLAKVLAKSEWWLPRGGIGMDKWASSVPGHEVSLSLVVCM